MLTSGLLITIFAFVVGLAEVGGAGAGEARCGRRLVSGLFSRPRLPLGYSLVATVPRGACRLNVSEILPTDNYIALKLSNSSYIMNGEFAVSTPGSYDAAGARFQYSRVGDLDSVYAHGPILHPVDIMILYTQPNPSIKYEYYTESIPGELDTESRLSTDPEAPSTSAPKHVRRHHAFRTRPRLPEGIPRYAEPAVVSKEETDEYGEDNLVGSRMFMWKILAYTQCSRTCGGGIQIGKFRCVESSANGLDREVSPVHCSGSPPMSRRKRCGAGPCPPRWRAAPWTACPQCGPATRTRIVGCVQDHSKGITKINDHKCPAPKPETIQNCEIPNCNNTDVEVNSESIEEIDTSRFNGRRIQTDNFRDGPVYTVSVNNSDDVIGPEYSYSAAGGWLFTDWSECVGWCVGGGVQTRGVRCADPAGCGPRPDTFRTCSLSTKCEPYEGHWYTGDWSACSSTCEGKQVRGVLCIGGSGRHLRDAACAGPRPPHERDCGEQCGATWYMSDWSQCTGLCGEGLQRRAVWCGGGGGTLASEDCPQPRPSDQRVCQLHACTASKDAAIDVSNDSQRIARNEVTNTQEITTESKEYECIDKLNNCGLALQARLCHYKYYTQNCCFSCRGR
ncbi:unnamed protein product [Plutella xylostella]|uniref:(diamondback moth) hypothetical protein n=1 Tax=Plutella xylostella TaxID=51655 RepID=A0A8S4F6I5_PLUXY|nr:unnamed protein product [Plutella xylostella]